LRLVEAGQAATLGADDAGRHREGEFLTQRIADCQHPFAHPRGVGDSEGDGGEIGSFDLDDRDVGVGVAADHLGAELTPVEEAHQQLAGVLDHVIVGHDVTIARDDEAGALAPAALRRLIRLLVEEIVERRRHQAAAPGTGGRFGDFGPDVHHGRPDRFRDRDERVAPIGGGGRAAQRWRLISGEGSQRGHAALLRLPPLGNIHGGGEE
jgi:antitoxin (DNA-binding transcriptional repressor) of toxin-antitoxin stability system